MAGSATGAIVDVGRLRRVDHPNDLQVEARQRVLESGDIDMQSTDEDIPTSCGLDSKGFTLYRPGQEAFLIGQSDPERKGSAALMGLCSNQDQ